MTTKSQAKDASGTPTDGNLMSVKEAARELNWPTWRVYRANREQGPLSFTRIGRRVYVERPSIEKLLRTASALPPAPSTDCCSVSPTVPDSSGQGCDSGEPAVSDGVVHVVKEINCHKTGQRDLLPAGSVSPFAFGYFSSSLFY